MRNSHPNSAYKAPTVWVWSALVAVYIAWGSTYLAMHYGVMTIPPFILAGSRFMIAGSSMLIFRLLSGERLPDRRSALSASVSGLLLLLAGNGAVVWAEQTVPSGLAALMVSSSPLWMMILEALRPKAAKIGWRASLGVAVGLAGVVFLLWPTESDSLLRTSPVGAVVLIFATLAWSAGSIYSRYAPQSGSPMMATAIEMLSGGVALIVLAGVTGEFARFDLARVSWQSWAGLAYLIVGGSLIGFTAYTWLLQVAPISLVSTYAFVNPLVALGIGAVLAQETISPTKLLAALVIVASVALTTGAHKPAEPELSTAKEDAAVD